MFSGFPSIPVTAKSYSFFPSACNRPDDENGERENRDLGDGTILVILGLPLQGPKRHRMEVKVRFGAGTSESCRYRIIELPDTDLVEDMRNGKR